MQVNSAARISFVSGSLLNDGMPTIDEVYRANLKELARLAGSSAKLSEQIGKSPSQISQWLNGSVDSKTGKPRSMSRATARFIEKRLGKPAGWMDQIHDHAAQQHEQPHEAKAEEPLTVYELKPGELFDALTEEEKHLLENFRSMLDDDQKHFAEEISVRAAKMRAYTAKVLERVGASSKPARSSADAKKTEIARAALEITSALRQRSLFDPLREEDGSAQ